MSQKSFTELGVSAPVADALAARSIVEPFRIQVLVLPDALAGRFVIAHNECLHRIAWGLTAR